MKENENTYGADDANDAHHRQTTPTVEELFRTFNEDFNNFEDNHEAKRKKLFDDSRRPKRRAARRVI